MLFTNSHGEYLTGTGRTADEKSSAVVVRSELVSSCIVRFRIDQKYICCLEGPAFLSDRGNDASLFLNKFGQYYTVRGKVLSLDRQLVGQDPDLPPDLQIEYLTNGQVNRLSFLKNGWTSWKPEKWQSEVGQEQIKLARSVILEHSESRIGNLFELNSVFAEFLKCSELKELLDQVYSQYHLTTYSSNALRKEDPDGRKFHVDYPYHDLESPYPEALLGVQVIFALDDFTYENGATSYIPDSFYHRCYPENLEQYESVYMTVPKGSWIVFRGDLWHSQGINITENPRVALLANFSPLSVPAKDPVSQQAVDYFSIVDGKVIV